ncbi:MAG TPA: DUF222 domain-containing protein [Candidatus Dormibacteraeota bacterium]|nr:DUF222 domain-containing protein [Candidatus Dormibacteraeota bacterium]
MIAAERPWGQDLVDLEHQIALLELEAARMAAELDADIDWIRFSCHLTSTAAADRLNVGRQMARMPESIQALRAGEIGYAHLKVMARTADAVGRAFDEKKLLKLAKENSPGKFHFKCMHYRHSIDAESYAQEQEELHESRGLRLSTAEDGCLLISGALDPVGGAVVRTTLEALAQPSGAHDDRPREHRLADALLEVCTHGGQQKIALEVTASIETLLGLAGAPGAENEFSLPIASKTVGRWACDCSLSRVLLQDSVVIDVGRAVRTIGGAKRRALNARDRHCRWPGCERPAGWCDGHHLKPWIQGGSSELENLTLLCGRHHRLVHEGGWQLIKTEDGRLLTIAPPTTFRLARAPD